MGVLLSYPNLAANTALSGGSWNNIDWMQENNNPPARSTDALVTSTQFRVGDIANNVNSLLKAAPVRCISIIGHNLSLFATIRVIAYPSTNQNYSIYDSGQIQAVPQEFNMKQASICPNTWIHVTPYDVYARCWDVFIEDPGNPNGYVEIYKIWIGGGLETNINIAWDPSFQFVPRDIVVESFGGVEWSTEKTAKRSTAISYGNLNVLEKRQMMLMQKELSTHGDLMFVFDTKASPEDMCLESYHAKMKSISPLSYPYIDVTSMPMELVEIPNPIINRYEYDGLMYHFDLNSDMYTSYGGNPLSFSRTGSQTIRDYSGKIITIPDNVPGFEGTRLAMNLIPNAEDIASWTIFGGTVTSVSIPSPINQVSYKMQSSTTSNYLYSAAYSGFRMDVRHNASVYVQSTEVTELSFYITWHTGGVYQKSGVKFNCLSGAIASSHLTNGSFSAATSLVAVLCDNGWWRISFSGQNTDLANTLTQVSVEVLNTTHSIMFLCCPQIEYGTVTSEYVPTYGAPISSFRDYALGDIRRDRIYDGLGIQLEPASTNICKYSENMYNTPWIISRGVTTHSLITSPDGTQNACVISAGSDLTQTMNTAHNSTVALSFYIKSLSATNITAYFKWNSDFSDYMYIQMNPLAGTVITAVGAGGVGLHYGEMLPVGNGWYRVFLASQSIIGTSEPVASTVVFTGYSYGGEYSVWGIQVEESPIATSYIPTKATTMTRGASRLSLYDNNVIIADRFSILMEVSQIKSNYIQQIAVNISDSTTNNTADEYSINIYNKNGAYYTVASQYGENLTEITPTAPSTTFIEKVKVGIRCFTNNCNMVSKGTLGTTDRSYTIGAQAQFFQFGSTWYNAPSSDNMSGFLKNVSIYGEGLSDIQLKLKTK
jgi:hypothetical protein